ncbi:hypothetical protein, partial [uncultured Megasphaera sp.]|uniref:hypothetical protein n=1 Tax=uncultured Megasphaera sp. TaxID=165188 RepID=UPI00266D22AF
VGVHSVHCSVFKGHRVVVHRGDLIILTNSEELVKDEFDFFQTFFKTQFPSISVRATALTAF